MEAPPQNISPAADFLASRRPSDGLQKVNFDGRGSGDVDGEIVSYSWDFGDGSPVVTGETVAHTYGAPGNYTAKLIVKDNAGATDFDSESLSLPVAPRAALSSSTRLLSSANPSTPGQPVMFTAQVSGPSDSPVPSGSVQFAVDGVSLGGPVPLNSEGQAVSSASSSLSGGTHDVTASYAGNFDFEPSPASLTQTVVAGSPLGGGGGMSEVPGPVVGGNDEGRSTDDEGGATDAVASEGTEIKQASEDDKDSGRLPITGFGLMVATCVGLASVMSGLLLRLGSAPGRLSKLRPLASPASPALQAKRILVASGAENSVNHVRVRSDEQGSSPGRTYAWGLLTLGLVLLAWVKTRRR